ncbi:MAG: 2-phosphosulfolactate phosphatase [Bacteroidales bacterium]|nr:2-phosphosulfolactate phosphatase [Bacteroidales bacterium]
MKEIEICLSPALYHHYKKDKQVVVVIDVIRASASICTAFHSGVSKIFPVTSTDEAILSKEKGRIISGERNSLKLEGFDLGNSPYEFKSPKLKDKELTMTTTNGTLAIQTAQDAHQVLIGSFINFDTLLKYLLNQEHDVMLLCAGWEQKVNIEDTLFAGKVAQALVQSGKFTSSSDAVSVAIEIYNASKENLFDYIISNSPRLKSKLSFLEDDIWCCLYGEQLEVLPVLKGKYLVDNSLP